MGDRPDGAGVTDVALKEYLEERIDALRRELAVQRDADQRAIELAHEALQRRLDLMNEFRNQIRDERGEYVRIDTFRWTVGFIVALLLVVAAFIPLFGRAR